MKKIKHIMACNFFIWFVVGIVLLSFCNISYSAPAKFEIADISVAGADYTPRKISNYKD